MRCCARAASGHAATPPSAAMKSRCLIMGKSPPLRSATQLQACVRHITLLAPKIMIILVWACGISQIKAESPQLRKHADKAPHSGLGPLAEIRRFDESPTIAEGSMVSKQKEAPQNGGGAEPALPTRFMVSAVL